MKAKSSAPQMSRLKGSGSVNSITDDHPNYQLPSITGEVVQCGATVCRHLGACICSKPEPNFNMDGASKTKLTMDSNSIVTIVREPSEQRSGKAKRVSFSCEGLSTHADAEIASLDLMSSSARFPFSKIPDKGAQALAYDRVPYCPFQRKP